MANQYHLIGWKEVIEDIFGNKTFYLLSEDQNGKVNGILPLSRLKSLLFGNFIVSLPYFNYGGICTEGNGIKNQLLEESIKIAKTEGASFIELRETSSSEGRLPEKVAKVSMRLSLPGTPDDLWGGFPSKLKSQIKRPLKEGIITRIGREEELDSFYQVFSMNMKCLGTPVYPKRFFKKILDIFPDSTWICSAYKGKNPIAAGFLVGFKNILEIPWASSLRNFNRFSPNMLLYWETLKFAIKKSFLEFDFGRSTQGEGTYKFKEQWGGKPVPLYWHYWLKNGEKIPDLNPKNPKFQMAISIWRRLPLFITQWIGPYIVKKLP